MQPDQLPIPSMRKITFSKDVTQESIESITKEILRINESDEYLANLYKIHDITYTPKPIEIYIDSYGGYVYQILGLLNIIGNSKTKVHTIVTGCAMSCGFMLLISGHKRFGYKLSTGLYHSVSSGHSGAVQDLQERLEETQRLQRILEELTLEKTKISAKKLNKIKKRKIDWFMDSKEMLKLNVIDEII